MGDNRAQNLTAAEAQASETSVLERTATGLRDALAATRVYAGTLDGVVLRIRASAPMGSGIPAPVVVGEIEGLRVAAEQQVVTRIEGARPPFDGPVVLVIPWTAKGITYGLGVAILAEEAGIPGDAVLAFLGAKVGSSVAALRECEQLAHRVASLQGADGLLERVIEHSSEAIKAIDLDGHVLQWNGGAEYLYGWPLSEVVGRTMPHVPEDMRLRAIQDLRSIASVGRVVSRQSVALRRDGSTFIQQVTIIPTSDADGNPSGVLSLAHQLDQRIGRDRMKEDFVSVVSQELKGPLTALTGFAQLLARPEILDDPIRRSRTIKGLEERASAMAKLVDELVLVSELHDNRLEIEVEPVDLTGMVADLVAHFEDGATSRRFVIDFDSSLGALPLDRRRMTQALTHLLSNAVKYSHGGDVAVTVGPRDGMATIEVSDVGIGIEPAELPNVFEPFYRTDMGINREYPGAGIGLYLTRMIVEAHGGSVSAASTPGHGSTFTISLPLAHYKGGPA
ncbi:MAG: ATP-binding protein [Actinomycetota bacterium]|nr:ATP-binding protein [Actinomycetota bacterium]